VTEEQVTEEQVTEGSEDLLPVDEGYDATSNDNDLNVSTLILEQCLLDRYIQVEFWVFGIGSSQTLGLRRSCLVCRRFG
jgi:hypothetical protein